VVEADGGGGLRWSELMVEVAYSGQSQWWWQCSCMWVGAHHVNFWLISVGRRDEMIFIYLQKCVIATGLLTSAGSLLLCCTVETDQIHPLLLCNHCSDGIVAMSHLRIATVGYNRLVQGCIVVVCSNIHHYRTCLW
jgi:hypothetical protein